MPQCGRPPTARAMRLDGAEVRLVVAPVVLVHGDVAGVAAVRGRQPDVVGGGEAHLDREADLLAAAREVGLDLGEHARARRRAAPRTPSRGTAPCRGEANTRYERSMKSRADSAPAATPVGPRDQGRAPGGHPVDRRRRRCWTAARRRPSRAAGPAGAARCPAAPGCCAWSAPAGCAGTSRTRSGRCRRRASSSSREHVVERAPAPRTPRARTPARTAG